MTKKKWGTPVPLTPELIQKLATKPKLFGMPDDHWNSAMNLYHWNSKVLEAYGEGDIIVMAENVEQARDKVYAMFDPLQEDGPFEDSYLQMLHMNKDEDYMTEFMNKLNELREDLNKEPTIVSSDVVLIRGSD